MERATRLEPFARFKGLLFEVRESPLSRYSGSPAGVDQGEIAKRLFHLQGPHGAGAPKKRSLLLGVDGQVFVRGVEVKATVKYARNGT